MLRLISGVLHRDVGGAVGPEDRDLRPAELAVVVPLVACLLALSAWPAAISDRAFADDSSVTSNFSSAEAAQHKTVTIIVSNARGGGLGPYDAGDQP